MRRLCVETGRATGLSVPPKRKVRCIVCGGLTRIVPAGEHLVVGRHYVEVSRTWYPGKIYEGTQR